MMLSSLLLSRGRVSHSFGRHTAMICFVSSCQFHWIDGIAIGKLQNAYSDAYDREMGIEIPFCSFALSLDDILLSLLRRLLGY